MEFFNGELLFSLLSILLALFLTKLASAASIAAGAGGGSTRPHLEEEEEETSIEPRAIESDLKLDPPKLLKEEVYEFGDEEEEEEEGWEGIERSELDARFRDATEYADGEDGSAELAKASGDVRMRLYALRKIATEGPCFEHPPMALKLSARARWQAWKQLGNMSPDASMELYISLLSDSIPGWMGVSGRHYKVETKVDDIKDQGTSKAYSPDLGSSSLEESGSETHGKVENLRGSDVEVATTSSRVFEKGLTKALILDLLSPTRVAFLFC